MSSANDFNGLRVPRQVRGQVHELALALLIRIEADEEVSDLEVRQLAAAVLEAEPVWLAMQVLSARRPIMRAFELSQRHLRYRAEGKSSGSLRDWKTCLSAGPYSEEEERTAPGLGQRALADAVIEERSVIEGPSQ